MERVKKGEKYWYIDELCRVIGSYDGRELLENERYSIDNYFPDRESAESTARKLRAVLKGADVIEMPSEEEIEKEAVNIAMNICGDDYWRDCEEAVHKAINYLKSKIMK